MLSFSLAELCNEKENTPMADDRSVAPFRANTSARWVTVGMLWLVFFFNYSDRQAIYSVFPLIKQQLQLTDVQLGVLGSCFMWMYALCGPVAGWVSDRISRKKLIIGSLIFWSVMTSATAIARNFGELVACRALGGLGEAFYFPAAMSMISDFHGPRTRSRAMSFHQSAVYIGSIAGGSISGYVGEHRGWQASFVVFGVGGALLGLILMFFLREPVRGMSEPAGYNSQPLNRTSTSEAIHQILGNRTVLLLIAIFMGANFVAVVFLTWLPTFLHDKFHMSLTMAGLNGTVYLQIASLLGVASGGFLADRLSRRHFGGRLLTQSIGLLAATPFLFLTGWTISVPILIVAMIGFGYFKGWYEANLIAGLYDFVAVEDRGAAAGILNSLGWLGGGTAPIIIAVASARFGMSASISATAGLYFFIGAALLIAASTLGRRAPIVTRATTEANLR
jgi:predicted MFS family arabinose efflux permease